MITDGQARRIAAEWQAPNNYMSWLQSFGTVTADTIDEIERHLEDVYQQQGFYTPEEYKQTVQELLALRRWCGKHLGQQRVLGWSDKWDDTRVDNWRD